MDLKKDSVKTNHPSYDYYAEIWERCRDCVKGQKAIKSKAEKYLPKPHGMGTERYKAYLKRAQFYNATGRTVDSIKGQIFRRDPVINTSNNEMLEKITIDKKSIQEYSKNCIDEFSTVGRVGTLADVMNETREPYIAMYKAESIINWKSKIIEGKKSLSLVVLKEAASYPDQVFTHSTFTQYRVLGLDENNRYYQQVYIEKEGKEIEILDPIYPKKDGSFINRIPFFIWDASGEEFELGEPVISDLVDVNLGHYLNSADHENDCHWSGIKTAIVPGWPKDEPLPLGQALFPEIESKPYIMESSGSSMLSDELTKKEERMATLGSQILAQKGRYLQSAKTAEEGSKGESGILASASSSLAAYIKEILDFVYDWGKWGEVETVSFNKDFDPGEFDVQALVNVFGLIAAGQIPETIGYNLCKRYELINSSMTLEEFREAKNNGVSQE